MAKHKLLIIDDDVDICMMLSRFLSKKGYDVKTSHNGKQAIELFKQEKFDLVFCDFRLGSMDGRDVLMVVREISPETPVIIITGYSDVKVAIDVIKNGAYDYIIKPLLPDEILNILEKALSEKTSPRINTGSEAKQAAPVPGVQSLRKYDSNQKYIVGTSKISLELEREIELVAPTNYSVIIYGESGTGKESVAQSIHQKSKRSNHPFVAVDCGALSKELAGSELFGHEKGAFTGAINAKEGSFEFANGGTIFLDEIANLSYDIQTSLLRSIQERKVKRLGSTRETEIDVRIIIASNEKLTDAVSRGKFREDLFYRFNEFSIHVAPLRERGEDIMLFAEFFLSKANEELGRTITGFSDEVIRLFHRYQWPGNLRELNNVIKRAALLSDTAIIELSTLPQELTHFDKFNFNEDKNHLNGDEKNARPSLKSAAQVAEQEMILNVLKQVNYNKSKAAKLLNIDRKTLYNKMKSLNLS
ncbi:MAG TPA: sigma-54 dependent transcriptional regulator [Chitinophagales bacterium]|nr:sigma-54 dependent transcriptional regulator [Chitinophagales bacterium]